MFDGYVVKAAVAGAITRRGSDRKSITFAEAIADGLPVKEVDGVAKVLEADDGLDAMIGVKVRVHDGWALQVFPQEGTVLSIGFIQVPIAEDDEPKRNQSVFFDPENNVFTTDKTKTPVRAVFAANGQADGCAEIEVVQQVAVATSAAA